ncbi:MAG: hypothetical protein NTU88_10240 [Armatimonadetes bacterium]|nr:hypothetical protein [Armatimonadota bacterium]
MFTKTSDERRAEAVDAPADVHEPDPFIVKLLSEVEREMTSQAVEENLPKAPAADEHSNDTQPPAAPRPLPMRARYRFD